MLPAPVNTITRTSGSTAASAHAFMSASKQAKFNRLPLPLSSSNAARAQSLQLPAQFPLASVSPLANAEQKSFPTAIIWRRAILASVHPLGNVVPFVIRNGASLFSGTAYLIVFPANAVKHFHRQIIVATFPRSATSSAAAVSRTSMPIWLTLIGLRFYLRCNLCLHATHAFEPPLKILILEVHPGLRDFVGED